MTGQAASPVPVRVRAPGKVNLALCVDRLGDDGYHRVISVFQAVSLYEDVLASPADELSLTVAGLQAERVPTDATNLAWRAAELLAAHAGVEPAVALHIVKGVPTAGGMAGGSADAAAALVACDALWRTNLPREELAELAAELGSDVPFALVGHTAVGTGRGHEVTAAMTLGEYHWALGLRDEGLSTAAVYGAFDDAGGGAGDWDDEPPTDLMQALRAGDPAALGATLRNDLEEHAIALNPALAEAVRVARLAGALGVVVSGSGPTVAALGRSAQHALAIAAAMTAAGVVDDVATAVGGVPGARVVGGIGA
ncbi:4-diphosphocytidyl-2-C-methyl-D-erythritol kinase [Flavimobilis marinus]|uniref:4-diphosphocytidyl-2-C-methyl-D-erythritol kinase n=1 Tax=Flavimobilis marinus TaxID=285351 RepID=A0A1I2I7K4_9MICO|nr:4-(cytidine 5'-diphospho)-2-C-methyl-D-erythritol kinase [Flavimobilis marinus]GHG56559.1 4-diphosphocytidyl-2-C-methyl-D-erythritol kinase [Flavimobilis marinus]SFF36876.1 4-diphosphocytidyl-2-C-methyl-D-erythritol kinase [Flavimobilis marinus]